MQRHFRPFAAFPPPGENLAQELRRILPGYLGVAADAELCVRPLGGETIAAPLSDLLEVLSGCELAHVAWLPHAEAWPYLLERLESLWPLTKPAASAASTAQIYKKWQQFLREAGEVTPVSVAGKRRQDGPVDQPLHLLDDALGHDRVEPGHRQGEDAREPVDQRVSIRITVRHGITCVSIDPASLPSASANRKAEG